ncbi:MAG: hypothetical protein HQ472_08090 [Ignavibacteria bacterium]|nr:hypothetical protein [Ignavibacteria bacterium]
MTFVCTLVCCTSLIAQLTPEMEHESIQKRFDDFNSRRTPKGVVLEPNVRSKAIDAVRRMENRKTAESVLAEAPTWTLVGPKSTAGRVKAILFHPTLPGVVYIATAAGGIWKSTDLGLNWVPKSDFANAISHGALCFDPTDPSIIYAGTGEQVQNANTYLGAGLLRSTDDGETWDVLELTQVGSFSRIYAHPKNRDLLMASCMNSNGGVYKSLDRGATWTQMRAGQMYDMTINPEDVDEWFVSEPGTGIWRTSDGGATWANTINGIVGTLGRISVQQSATNPNVLYALASVNNLAVIYKSVNHGALWTPTFNDATGGCFFAGSCDASGSQAFYDNYVTVSPTDENVCFVAGIDIWRTTNGGGQWTNTTAGYNDGNGANLVHVDQHCLAFYPHTPKTVFAGNDGGVVTSTDFGEKWALRNNGLAITQFYSFDTDPTDRDKSYGGTQDNGTLGSLRGIEWDTIAGGDGMVTVVNQKNPKIVYGNQPNGRMFRINYAKNQFQFIMSGIDQNESALWAAPLTISPEDDQMLYHGRRRVWRSFDGGDFWDFASPLFTNSVSAIKASPANSEVVWAGSNSGELMVSEDLGFEWKKLARTELSNNYISDIECSHSNSSVAWVSYSTYGSHNLWKTTDVGKTWTSLWNGMPDIPVNDIEVHPADDNIIFIATDAGVFATYDGGKNWLPYGKGLPRSPVMSMKLNTNFGYIRVVTHGRSGWEAPLITTLPSSPVITSPHGGDIYYGSLHTTISWSGFTAPVTVEYSVNNGQKWDVIATDVVGSALQWKVVNWPTVNGRIRITSQTKPEQSEVSNSFSIFILDKGGITQKTAVNWVPYGLAWDGANGLWSTSFYERKIYKIDATTLRVLKVVDMPASVGDSLFTDITMDRSTGTLYLHRLNGSTAVGAVVIAVDTNGNLVKVMTSQARNYATGIEFVDGKLVLGERDGLQKMYVMNLDGSLVSEAPNPYKYNYGPRCLAYDDNNTLFQTCTFFPTAGGSLTECYLITIDKNDLSKETGRLALNGPSGLINARAVEYDRADRNFWIGDFGGNIYKIAGFYYVAPPVTGIDEQKYTSANITVAPNPTVGSTLIGVAAVNYDRRIELTVADMLGRPVTTLYKGTQVSGQDIALRWDGSLHGAGTYTVVATSNGTVLHSATVAVVR